MILRDIRAVSLHLERLQKVSLVYFQSNRTCLLYIRRTPENILSCRYSSCDVCIRIFGIAVSGCEYRYKVDKCILCGIGLITTIFKPPTAGPRILSVDGGGVRGVVPLEFLDLLQSTIGPGYPVQELFDLAFGTSSGRSY